MKNAPYKMVQLSRHFGHGTGVASVATSLERAFLELGCSVERFELSDTRFPWRGSRRPSNPVLRRLFVMAEALWYGMAATRYARRLRRFAPSVVTISHADPSAGDIFVNHGLLSVALSRKSGIQKWVGKVAYLPLTWRESRRLRSNDINVFINLSQQDALYTGRKSSNVAIKFATVPNGADIEHFRHASLDERSASRSALGVSENDQVIAFVGHEFRRKGLYPLLDAMTDLPQAVRLLVAGGDDAQIAAARRYLPELTHSGRVIFLGRVSDIRQLYWAADVFCLPSKYETGQLVLLEAMATGLPVVATPVGMAPEVLVDTRAGLLVDDSQEEIGRAVTEVLTGLDHEPGAAATAARAAAETYSWPNVAETYIGLAQEALERRGIKLPSAGQNHL